MNHASGALKLSYNPKWLCILKSTNHLHLEGNSERLKFEQRYVPTAEEEKVIQEIFKTGFDIPKNFSQTVTVFDPEEDEKLSVVGQHQSPYQPNPQTVEFCGKLNIMVPEEILRRNNLEHLHQGKPHQRREEQQRQSPKPDEFREVPSVRPKLNLLPRTVKNPINALAETMQQTTIFGRGAQPRQELVPYFKYDSEEKSTASVGVTEMANAILEKIVEDIVSPPRSPKKQAACVKKSPVNSLAKELEVIKPELLTPSEQYSAFRDRWRRYNQLQKK